MMVLKDQDQSFASTQSHAVCSSSPYCISVDVPWIQVGYGRHCVCSRHCVWQVTSLGKMQWDHFCLYLFSIKNYYFKKIQPASSSPWCSIFLHFQQKLPLQFDARQPDNEPVRDSYLFDLFSSMNYQQKKVADLTHQSRRSKLVPRSSTIAENDIIGSEMDASDVYRRNEGFSCFFIMRLPQNFWQLVIEINILGYTLKRYE